MTGSKFSKQLQTTKRKWLTELREGDSSLGGWNADATVSDRPMGEFEEVLNMRKMRPGELEVRSGYNSYEFPDPTNAQVPLWKAEYRMDSVFVDVTFFAKAGDIYALVLRPSDAHNVTIKICPAGTSPIVCAYQYQTYLVVSVTSADLTDDLGMYGLFPTDKTLLLWNPDAARPGYYGTPLGKQLTPTPTGFYFSLTTQGKLQVFVPANTDGTLKYKIDALTGEPITVPLDINAPYFLSNNSLVAPLQEPLWTKHKKDPSSSVANHSDHAKSRGWNVRAVLKRKFKDARGQDHFISEAPSADWYVEEVNYTPPVVGWLDANNIFQITDVVYGWGHCDAQLCLPHEEAFTDIFGHTVFSARPNLNAHWRDDGSDHINNFDVNSPSANPDEGFIVGEKDGQYRKAIGFPTNADYFALRAKFKSVVPSASGTADPYFFAASWLGWWDKPDAQYAPTNVGCPPYKLAVGAHDVNGSPNVVYTWAMFGLDPTTDSTLYAIDIYRTPYSYPDEKDNATRNPIWGTPYNYGYVGTLSAGDANFLDNVADTSLLFEENPDQADGYLQGQFSGQVMRDYQDHLVLGNIRTKYKVRTPWSGIQSFGFGAPSSQIPAPWNADDFNRHVVRANPPTDGYPPLMWFYSYQDRDGNISDAVPILTDAVIDGSTTANVAFVFPRGYSDRIVSAILYLGKWNTGTSSRDYYREATVPLSVGLYVSPGANSNVTVTIPSLPGGDTVEAIDPGYIIWSKLNNPWEWPIENIENEHDQNPITGLDEVIGPLYVFCDKGIQMTRLNGYREPVHTSGTGVGCISRYACVKVDKVVFFLSASGLYFVEGSGVVPFPANIDTEITRRLREVPPVPYQDGHGNLIAQPSLFGVRERASMSYLSNRKELWITFPSTADLHGTLPARTFVIKFFGKEAYAYEFEIASGFSGGRNNPPGTVIHLPHADGSLWSAYYDPGDPNNPDPSKVKLPALVVQDNDVATKDWPGEWAVQYQNSMNSPNVTKGLFGFNFTAASLSRFWQTTGMIRTDGIQNRISGTLMGPPREIRNLGVGTLTPEQIQAYALPTSEYRLPISGAVSETSGTPPGIRLYGTPDQFGQNRFKLESFDIYFGPQHQHKGD